MAYINDRVTGWAKIALGAVLLTSAPAGAAAEPAETSAPNDDPAALFDRAVRLHESGKFDEAARTFMLVYDKAPTGQAAFNAAAAWEEGGDLAGAANAYRLALTEELTPVAVRDATSRLEALSKTLGVVKVNAPVGARIKLNGREPRDPGWIYVDPGNHSISVELQDGAELARDVQVAASEARSVIFERKTPKAEPPSDRVEAPAKGNDIPWTTLGWSGVAAGGALALTATFLGVKTLDARDDYDASGFTDRDARDQTLRLQTWTNVAWGSAIVLGGAGVAILVVRPGEKRSGALRITPAGATYSASF